ncbi:MAG: protease modulator HflC, partial [Candidatus Altiarchaeota archaeon]|nr:protease modulator HflC [Candidatus Altiarchaeota archaeon]
MDVKKARWEGLGKPAALLAVVTVLFLFSMVFVIVDETENVVVTQFGKPVLVITDPGLYFKLPEPFQTVKRFDKRLVISESQEAEVLTSDKKNLVMDYYVVWAISDPLKFMQTVVNEDGAKFRISDIVYSELRRHVGLHDFKDIINYKRDEINSEVIKSSNDKVINYGILISDVKIRRMNFPTQNLGHVYDRMRSERSKIANQYRSEGEEESLKIKAETDKTKNLILSEASKNASILKGEGDAEATK